MTKYQPSYSVVEVIEREPFRTTVTEFTSFREAALAFGQRWYQVLELYLIDSQGNQIAHHSTTPDSVLAPPHIIGAAGLQTTFTVEVEDRYEGNVNTYHLDIDGKIVRDGRNAHVFHNRIEAQGVAANFNRGEAGRFSRHPEDAGRVYRHAYVRTYVDRPEKVA